MTIHPCNDRLLIKRDESETQTRGGLYLPDNAKERPQRGVVLAVGPGRMSDFGIWGQPPAAPNARVLFTKHAGDELRVDGELYMLVRFADILAVLTEPDNGSQSESESQA